MVRAGRTSPPKQQTRSCSFCDKNGRSEDQNGITAQDAQHSKKKSWMSLMDAPLEKEGGPGPGCPRSISATHSASLHAACVGVAQTRKDSAVHNGAPVRMVTKPLRVSSSLWKCKGSGASERDQYHFSRWEEMIYFPYSTAP